MLAALPNNSMTEIGSRISISNTPTSVPSNTTQWTVEGGCIETFGTHRIDWQLTPGGFNGSLANPCAGSSFSFDIDLSALAVVEGPAQLILTLFMGDNETDTETFNFTITAPNGNAGLACPGGGTHAYNGQAPDDIRNQARQAAEAVNAQYPGLIGQACPGKRGSGNNDFLYRVVQRLRQDPVDGFRWGLNGKRGAAEDMSEDVVDYNWGTSTQTSLKLETYVFDVIVACEGPNPSPTAIDVTLPNVCGRWILPASYPY
jgi:hypothetical protein